MKIYVSPQAAVIKLTANDIMNGGSNEAYVEQGTVNIAGTPTATAWGNLYDGSEY